jgi:anaerobic magnesium-protoporphyrin IX monomethyl ester cyclase
MNVLLVYPYCLEERLHEEDVHVVPMGLYYIGALLKANGHEVAVLNLQGLKDAPEQIRALLEDKQPDIIGFSILNANRWGGIEVARLAKALNPAVTTVFGGVTPTFLWRHFLAHFAEIDYVVIGEGEFPFLNLVQALQKTPAPDLAAVEGLAWRDGQRVVCNPAPRPIRNLDGLPQPARYFRFQHVALTRGCRGNCTFCGSPLFWGRRVRFHSTRYFVDQLELLYRQGVTFFYVSDDTFMVSAKRVIAICREIIRRKLPISWAAISRVDLVQAEVLGWMRRAGCTQISYGVESGSAAIRRDLNKPLETAQIARAFDLTVRYGLFSRAYFIYGCPGESDRSIAQTLALIAAIKPLSVIFYVLDVFPGTALYADFRRRFGLTDDIWLKRIEDILYCEYDPALPPAQVKAWGRQLREGFQRLLPEIVDNIPLLEDPQLAPLHADFLSRLAMTFSHGDYARIEAIADRDGIAARLYDRALAYHPDPRAFLGRAILHQKAGAFGDAARLLARALRHYPQNEALNICQGINLINLNQPQAAIAVLLNFPDAPQAAASLAACYKALGNTAEADRFARRHRDLTGGGG